jgi:hypothetical protein
MRRCGLFLASLALLSCSAADPPRADGSLLPKHVGLMTIEATYDGAPSFLEVIDPETHVLTQNSGVGFDDDPHLRKLVDPRDGHDRLFLVGSSNGLLTELSEKGAILSQHSVADVSTRGDPLDVAIAADGSLWVTRYFARTVLVLEPDGQPRKTIDLSSHAPADGPSTRAPGMSAVAIVGQQAFVALRRLDGGARPTNVSQIAVIDVATGNETASIDLPLADPGDHFVLEKTEGATRLWISCIGAPFTRDDVPYGLVAIDTTTRTVVRSLDLRKQGLFVSDFAVAGAHDGYASVARYLDRDNPSMVVRFDPETGAMDPPWMSKPTYALRGLALSGGLLLVTHWDAHAPGIELFDVHRRSHLGHLATRLPPVEVVALGLPAP